MATGNDAVDAAELMQRNLHIHPYRNNFGMRSTSLRTVLRYPLSLLIIAAAVAVMAPLAGEVHPTTVALLLLLVILLIATAFGSRYALTASMAAALGFNFFFLPPHFTLHIADTENWVAFAAFVVTALVAGQLSTYAKRQAAESEKRRQKIEGLYEELQSAFEQASEAEALRRSEKLKSSLLDAITHDLRTPLTSIKASVTTLLEDTRESMLDDDGRDEFLEIIDEETDRLNEFIEGMVGIAKIEAGAMKLAKRSAAVDEIVANAVQRAEKLIGDRRVKIEMPAE